MSELKTFVDIRNEYMNETYESFTTEDKESTFGFTDAYVNWLENKLGQANAVTTGEKQCNLPVVNGWRLFQNEDPPLNKEIEVAELGYPMKRKITISELQFYKWNNYCWREV